MSYVIYMETKRDYKKESDELGKLQRAAIAAKDFAELARLTILRKAVIAAGWNNVHTNHK